MPSSTSLVRELRNISEKRGLVIASTADIHSPKHLEELRKAVKKVRERPDLVLLAGDLINKGKVDWYAPTIETISKLEAERIIAIFGNEEYDETHDMLKEEFGDIVTFLDDESIKLEIKGVSLGVVGTKGSLEQPTTWQERNIPGIREVYEKRVKKVEKLLMELDSDIKILLMHYSPTFKTLFGEYRNIWPQLGHRGYEKVIEIARPDLVIHAHAHNGSKRAVLWNIEILNVSFPLWREIVVVKLSKRADLEQYF
ncbi:MAG TPA: metallophosphoesterase [Candidatus Korarchaeota archaeon]|nr:metallophosphoesterase [Candidatus Korarchaeota archaeon]